MDRSDDNLTPNTAPWLADPVTQKLCLAFEAAGKEVFFVGGCVRNAVLGAPVSDIDFATAARPDQTTEIAEQAGFKAIPTGLEHGTITIVADGVPFEVTTFRKDVETDGRHAEVAFSDHMKEDARRRDFTMNALYADRSGRVFDPVRGMDDARAGVVRFIDDPHDRIREDYLRILRFFRFSAWYGDAAAGMNSDALAAIAELVDGLDTLSRERVGQEMLKLCAAPDPVRALASMQATHVLGRVLPGAQIDFVGPLQHLEMQTDTPPDALRRLAALGGTDIDVALRLSKAQTKAVSQMQAAQFDARSDPVLGQIYGAKWGWSGVLLQAAMRPAEVDAARKDAVAKGAAAVFPVSAADLQDRFEGPALGAELKRLKAEWLASDLLADKRDLLG